MDNHHTGQEETLMEVKLGMNGVALSRLSRTQPRRSSSFKCVLVSATLLTLAISLVVAIMVALFILLPQCNLDKPTSPGTAKVSQVNKLPGTNTQGTFDIFTANKSGNYFICGWLKFSKATDKDVTLSQTSVGQVRNLSTQKANKTEMSFCQKVKLPISSKISISHLPSCTDSLFIMDEL